MPRPSVRAPFVARGPELDQLAAAVERARRGEPGVVLVGADAGVGKTRLLTRAAELAADGGAAVVWSHCVDLGEVGLPYLPFTEALTTLRAAHEAVDATVAARPALARLLDATLPAAGEQSQGERLQLFESIAAALAASGSAQAPLVLVVEDLHWADPSSRDVLRFVVARLRTEHVVVVASYRTDDLHRRHPLRPVLAELRRHPRVEHVDLRPFTAAELRDFTTAVAGGRLGDAAFESVRTRSEGNAYFAEELVEAGPDGELPWSLADVLRARLEMLDPPVQHLVRAASVSGRQVSEPLLRAVLAQDASPDADPGAFDRALREAIAHHVLAIESGERRDVVVFRHALLAEAVASDLLPGERVTVHRAYLTALDQDRTLGSPALRAHHALAAHDLPAALVASRAAARKAARVLAPAEELRHLEQALSLWQAVPDAADLLGEDRVAVSLAAAGAASRAGDPDRAVALARKVVEATADDPLRQASLRHVLSRYLLGTERVEEVLAHTEAALAILPADPPSLDRAWTLATRARAALNADQDELATQVAAEALDEAHRVDAPDVEADVLTTMAVLEVEDDDRAAELLAQARERAVDAGDILTELRCWYNIAANRYYAGRLDDALRITRDGLDRARATGIGWSVYGVELRLFVDLARYALGDLTPTPASDETVPESSVPTLSCVQLYAAVARGDADAVDRGAALRRDWFRDGRSRSSPAAARSTRSPGRAATRRRSTSPSSSWSTWGARGATTSSGASGCRRSRSQRSPTPRTACACRARAPRRRSRTSSSVGTPCSTPRARPPSAAAPGEAGSARRVSRGSSARPPSTRASPARTTPRCGSGPPARSTTATGTRRRARGSGGPRRCARPATAAPRRSRPRRRSTTRTTWVPHRSRRPCARSPAARASTCPACAGRRPPSSPSGRRRCCSSSRRG
ncbi:AAA family ATPase [Cellulosimicrobium sp. CUA-896]|uniref:ATP-binding protein n=1 Tax=Cellulosimicrobium sp. CUA-896 TaxID=1517881 RepID=UPI00210130AF|nr:AAA family ATPase [Cellulosimicrobium sp. CUA-896]